MGIPLKLLIIEDSPSDADLIVLKLEKSGYDVSFERIEDGSQMWESLKRQSWDVIISDHNLPQFDSLRAMQVLKDSGLDIPFIIVSGAIGEEVAVRAMKSGAQDFVPKNNLTRLAAVVEHAVVDARGRAARRHAEAALKESEVRFRSLYENTTLGLYRTTPAGQILLANPALVEMLGYDSFDQLSQRNLQEEWLEPEYERAKFKAFIEGHGKVHGWEAAWNRKDGTRIYIRESAVAIRDAQGHTMYYDGTVEDITERKQTEEALKSARINLDMALSVSRAGIWDWNILTGQIDWSVQMYDTFGLDPKVEKASFESWRKTLYPDDRNIAESKIDQALKEHRKLDSDYRIVMPAGQVRWINSTGEGIYDAEGHPIRMTGICIDITERKKTEEALRNAAEEWRNTFDSISDMVALIDVGHRILRVNRAFAKAVNTSPDKLLGRLCYEVVHQASQPHQDCPFIYTKKSGQACSCEIFEKTLGIPLECTTSPLLDSDQHVIGTVHIFKDITERKQAEEAIIRDASKFRSTFDQSSVGSVIVGLDKRFIRCNTAFCNYLGYTESELIGKTIADITYPEDIELGMKEMKQLAQGEITSCSLQKRYLRKDGGIIWGEISISLVRGVNGEPLYFIPIIQNITERKLAEEGLATSEYFNRTIIENSPIGIAVRSKNHRLLSYNQAWVELWGLTQERIAIHSRDMTRDEFRQIMNHLGEYFDAVENLFQKGGSFSVPELKVTRYNSKEPLWIKQYFYSMFNSVGEVERVIILTVNITDRKQAEEENRKLREKAEVSSRLAAIGEMAAGIAHEINNPLTGVIGFSELLLENPNLPADIKDQLKIIAEGGNRVKDIVRRMLTFARQNKPVKNSVNIHELIDTTLDIRSYVLKTANIEVIKYYDQDLPWVVVDPGQMQQVFLNLIVNAEYAMKKAHGKGTLTITTEKIDGHIHISFKDDGEGMDNATREKLFHPFFSTKQVNEGTGLGLSLSRGIILEHGGTIEVESAPGKGATFIITLPLAQPSEVLQEEAAEVKTTAAQKVKTARILVVDDEEGIRKLAGTILAHGGHSVDATGDAREALTKLENNTYDVVLMDIRMPGMSGMELYERILEKHTELTGKFLFITGDTSDFTTRAFLEQNKLPYITKPFDRETLLQRVNNLLRGEDYAR